MRCDNPVESLAQAVYSCLENKDYLPDIAYQWQSPQERRDGKEAITKYRRPRVEDISVIHFPQMWGSTALGFGGIGGQAMTSAYTTVIIDAIGNGAVFFNGTHAYTIKDYNEKFDQDCHGQNMAPISRSASYHKLKQ